MRFKLIILVLFLLASPLISSRPAIAADDVIEVKEIEDVVIPTPPSVPVPACPIAKVKADVVDGAKDFCAGLADEINALIAKNQELIALLNNLRTEINTKAAEMQKVLTAASRVLRRLNACYGTMQGTRSCAGPGYQPGDWTNHNPNGDFDDMETARDDLIALRQDISAAIRAAEARIRALQELLANLGECKDEVSACATRDSLADLSDATDKGFEELAAIKAAALKAIADFNTAYASFKSKIAAFLAKTSQVIADNAPNSVRNIARTCGMSKRAAARERRRRNKVKRCLKKLRKQFNKLP